MSTYKHPHTPTAWKKKYIMWPLSGACTWLAHKIIQALPIDIASCLIGKLARAIGPLLPISSRAERNMKACFPDWTDKQLRKNIRDMWENLGRTAAEYPHIQRLDISGHDKRVEVVGADKILSLRDDNLPGIVFSGHLGNWEILPMLAHPNGLDMNFVYRALNSPLAEKVLRKTSGKLENKFIAKGRKGAIQMARVMREGGHLALMVDQKLNEGIEVPFFGRPAKTSTALAAFALRYRCPVIPARVERLTGAQFRVTFCDPVDLPDSGSTTADTLALMTKINQQIEHWVRDTPSQWLWLHRRWGK
ncbi:MAG: lauroyl acyltransferase [Rhodospirillaceae bacterium]|nr:lauroyl acyltransferase [Rhodospirillaceae bacterium]|tara:strand:+ start:5693 stop:6607 length:915 start_codon:yes stop_codon:yes gene_type:complete